MQASVSCQNHIRDALAAGEHGCEPGLLRQVVELLERTGILIEEFDWQDWYRNQHLLDCPERIAAANAQQCRQLLSALARLERYSHGVLAHMRRRGVLLALLERLWQLEAMPQLALAVEASDPVSL
ncbi:hypothetical protein JYB88_10355 [Shewanella cyperi]|uniref:Uncharacterized protein n=1 Tax=Shewanella cyperi TaxID=2814292 RepID=A0A974XK13_9GAMM|nr:DUF6508 domain-containing protein [Shewanella cyperi]QSX28688.1 hypothetical protein JYB88_10355 [Shewanella cyperi]